MNNCVNEKLSQKVFQQLFAIYESCKPIAQPNGEYLYWFKPNWDKNINEFTTNLLYRKFIFGRKELKDLPQEVVEQLPSTMTTVYFITRGGINIFKNLLQDNPYETFKTMCGIGDNLLPVTECTLEEIDRKISSGLPI